MSEFDGKVAIVTGASSGIGRCTAELLAQRGARVAAFARSADKLAGLASDRVLPVAGDVSHLGDVERLFSAAESHFGHVEVLINNAGMIDRAPLIETTFDEWQEMFAVNVHGAYLTCRRALPSMLERRAGAIVNVPSVSRGPGPEKGGEAELLTNLDEDMDLRALLPAKEVAKGDAWDIDTKSLKSLLLPGGDLKLKPHEGAEEVVGALVEVLAQGLLGHAQGVGYVLQGGPRVGHPAEHRCPREPLGPGRVGRSLRGARPRPRHDAPPRLRSGGSAPRASARPGRPPQFQPPAAPLRLPQPLRGLRHGYRLCPPHQPS